MRKLIILILVFFCTGCYDYHELNDLEIVSSLIVDYKDDEYVASIEVLDTSDSASTGSFFLSGTGQSLEEAMNNIYYNSALTPFYSHMKVLIFSENIAKKGLDEYFDFLLRDTQFRKDFYVFVSADVDAILDYETEPKESLGELARMSAKRNHEHNGRYKTATFREIAFGYLRDNYYMIGNLEIKDDKVSLEDTYLFFDNKMTFKVDKEAALLANFLSSNNDDFQIYGDYNYQIHNYSLSREVKKDKIVLSLKGHARLLETAKLNSLDEKALLELEEALNKKIENHILEIIDYAKMLDHDIFNFNYYYYLHNPKLVKDDSWKTISYEVKSDVTISEKGLLLNSLGGSKNGE